MPFRRKAGSRVHHFLGRIPSFMRQLVIQCRFGNLRPFPVLVGNLDAVVLDGNTTVEAGEGDEMPKSQILPSTGFLYRSLSISVEN
jgi:hypothetical protein